MAKKTKSKKTTTPKKVVKTIAKVGLKAIKKVTPVGRAVSVAQKTIPFASSAVSSFTNKMVASPKAKTQARTSRTGRRKQTIASIKRKIALLKAKKELAKVRGY